VDGMTCPTRRRSRRPTTIEASPRTITRVGTRARPVRPGRGALPGPSRTGVLAR
jgi:hypothetical protein